MYYVVYLVGINQKEKHAVFPASWLKDSEQQLQKFVKNRINRNQVHTFFWSNEKNSDGEPNTDVQPNFNLPQQKAFPPPIDGCFQGHTVEFFINYADAVAHVDGLRPVAPGLYNDKREKEAPLPDLNQNPVDPTANMSQSAINEPVEENDTAESFDELAVSSSTDGVPNNDTVGSIDLPENNEVVISNDLDENQHDAVDAMAQSSTDTTENIEVINSNNLAVNQNDSVASSSNDIHSGNVRDEVEIKPELHLLQRADVAEINAILNDNDSVVRSEEENESSEEGSTSDVIEWVVLGESFPMPVQYSCDGLIKRDNDPVSGDIAYDTPQVCVFIISSNFSFQSFCLLSY